MYEHEVKYAVNVTHSGNTSYCMTDAETFAAVLNNFDNIHSHCSNILLPSVCRWVYFPTCDPALSVPVPQRVCRRACEILTIFVCPEAWRLYIEQYHILSVPKGSSFTCDNLMYANGGDLPDCIDPLDGGEHKTSFIIFLKQLFMYYRNQYVVTVFTWLNAAPLIVAALD